MLILTSGAEELNSSQREVNLNNGKGATPGEDAVIQLEDSVEIIITN